MSTTGDKLESSGVVFAGGVATNLIENVQKHRKLIVAQALIFMLCFFVPKEIKPQIEILQRKSSVQGRTNAYEFAVSAFGCPR